MAYLIRSAKPGSDWNEYDLKAFNIKVQKVNAKTFFGISELPQPTVSSESVIFNNAEMPPSPVVVSKDERLFFHYLKSLSFYGNTAVRDFTAHLLKMLNFDDNNKAIVSGREYVLEMSGTTVPAMADLYVVDYADYPLVLVQTETVSSR